MPGGAPTLLASLCTALLLLAPVPAPAAEVLRISGTGSALGAIRELVPAFEKGHPGVTVKLLPSVGSAGAIQAVREQALEVGISSRPLRAEDRALGLAEVAYARTPFVFAAGPRVTATGLTPGELARIYRGELTRWPDGERIRLVLRPAGDVDTLTIRAISPELDAAMEVALGRDGLLMAATNQDCNEALARTPGSLGPTTLSQLRTEVQSLRALAWNGVEPTLANLASGAYPIAKTLHAVVRTPASGPVRQFLDFLGSAEARRILERSGCVPVPAPPRP
jgi:phosphate transport system substrate-binding protein